MQALARGCCHPLLPWLQILWGPFEFRRRTSEKEDRRGHAPERDGAKATRTPAACQARETALAVRSSLGHLHDHSSRQMSDSGSLSPAHRPGQEQMSPIWGKLNDT